MTAGAWRKLRQHWQLPLTPAVLAQRFVAGPLFSALHRAQTAATAERRRKADLSNYIIVLGYWRSGTTLLHNYLSLDRRFGFPSTYSCMNPQHFMLTQAAALRGPTRVVHRPMDDVEISAASPQEEEFALLALGARSPYEALLAPARLAETLRLGDPLDLPARECRYWQNTFEYFLRGVSAVEGYRPLILKSPPHGYRVRLLRNILPDARFVLIVRSPATVYESSVRMWRKLFAVYSLGEIPPEEETRRVVLEDRPRFESKLAAGLCDLPADRLALIRYEHLVFDPIGAMETVYDKLKLDGFSALRNAMEASIAQRGRYGARNAAPPPDWKKRLQREWRSVFERYGYEAD
jgi:omega-hydroxy-beta-dihydromenaquinone-9 sulfotransferase